MAKTKEEKKTNTGNDFLDSIANEGDEDLKSFFSELDGAISGNVFTEEVNDEQLPPVEEVEVEDEDGASNLPAETGVDQDKEELERLKALQPIADLIMEDPGVVDAIENYVSSRNAPKAPEVPEDFEFNSDEAFTNPESQSFKVFKNAIESIIEGKIAAANEENMKRSRAEADKINFMQKYGVSEQEFNEMMSWTNKHKMTLDDIYYLKNRKSIQDNIARNSIKSRTSTQGHGIRSLAGAATPSTKSGDPALDIFKMIKGKVGGNNFIS